MCQSGYCRAIEQRADNNRDVAARAGQLRLELSAPVISVQYFTGSPICLVLSVRQL